MGTEKTINFEELLLQRIDNNALALSSLISFLQENDEKFKNFELVSNINLSVQLTDTEENIFYDTLNECTKLPIEEIPNVKELSYIIQKKVTDKKFTPELVCKLLKAVIFEHKLTSTLGLIAHWIYK